MKKNIFILAFLLPVIIFTACEDFLEPEPDNRIDRDLLLRNPAYAEGLLLKAYGNLPSEYDFSMEAATDDAVTNNFNLGFQKMATGRWTSSFSPVSQWSVAYNSLYYLNYFLDVVDQVQWVQATADNQMHRQRLTGEAHGLRAWYGFLLLRAHAGPGPGGQLLGYPILNEAIEQSDNWELERNTFEQCVQQILADIDVAVTNLPDKFQDIPGDNQYNFSMGTRWSNRFTANAARALKSRLLLYVASPAFNLSNDVSKWETAAEFTGNFLLNNEGLSTIIPTGISFWVYPFTGVYHQEVIWATTPTLNNSLEARYFPPSIFGKAEVNPTQELVNAFPMANGYPITDPLSGYNPDYPYLRKDNRFQQYILHDSVLFGGKGLIRTYDGAPQNGINAQTNSTRSGYYLRKFILPGVTIFPFASNANHFYTYARFTEVVLNYAEAANEAWGPEGTGSIGISARQAVAALRVRAGIAADDPYLASLTSKEEIRELIHNERRIELCFEGHRFYDIRRWKKTDLMRQPVSGVFITNETPRVFRYEVIENRNYADHMIYGPIPLSETLKYSGLVQNQGW